MDNFCKDGFQENVLLANILLLGLCAVIVRRKRIGYQVVNIEQGVSNYEVEIATSPSTN